MDEMDCRVLTELRRSGNITKTAQKLFITQPAITKRIQKIEEELGCELLLRSKKGVVFTPAGEAILPHVASILDNSRIIREQAQASQAGICGSLSLGSSLNFAHYRLPSLLKQYLDLYPRVNVQIVTGQSRDLYHMLQQGDISVAILRGTYSWEEGIEHLSTEPMCLVCSRENAGRPLSEYPYIGRETDPNLTVRLQIWLNSHGLGEIPISMRINDIDTCKEMVRHGIGWCILPQICLSDFDGYREELFFHDGTPFVRNTYVLYRNLYRELPQVSLFLEMLGRS